MSEHANLWPADLLQATVDTPVVLLREQASQLGPMTQGRLAARVRSNSEMLTAPSIWIELGKGAAPIFRQSFEVVAPHINFAYVLFDVFHGPNGYPAILEFWGTDRKTAANREELEGYLQQIFADNRTKRLIASIIAMVGPPSVPTSAT